MTHFEEDDMGDYVVGDLLPEQRRRYAPIMLRTTWLALGPADGLWWEGIPDVPFRPRGLLLVDVPKGALLHEWASGSVRYLPIGNLPVNLSSFEALDRIIQKRPEAAPTLPSIVPGQKLRLRVSTAEDAPLAPPSALTVWGVTER